MEERNDKLHKPRLVCLTGAGMSVESGFKTFRGQDGLWEDFPVEQVATHSGWEKDPVLVNNFYNMLRRKLWNARPNEGHRILARLEERFDVTVVTQNVDDLHERAGSSCVVHLHGELSKVCSSDCPDDPRFIRQLTPDHSDVAPGERAGDGSLLRPYIVFFQEMVPKLSEAAAVVRQADVMVIVGTSLNVYPAAGLTDYLRPNIPIFLIDPDRVRLRLPHLIHLQMGASAGMAQLEQLLSE